MNKNKGVYFFIGTTAELIKVFPVMRELDRSDIEYSIIASGQNPIASAELWDLTEKTHSTIELSNLPIKQSAIGLLLWFISTLLKSIRPVRKILLQHPVNTRYLIVHGDTVSTLMGAILGRLAGAKILHIEAGLRSFNWLKPFPEEICRVIVSRLTTVSFCPNEWAVQNLKDNNTIKVNTFQNTLLDSMRFVASLKVHSNLQTQLGEKYFIFIMHRQENLFDPMLLEKMIRLIIKKSNEMKCLFILHKPTRAALEKFNLIKLVSESQNIITSPRLSYVSFTKILAGCDFIVTDGGSNQEESFYFGKPCCVLRTETERTEGIGHNVLLSKMDFHTIGDFLQKPSGWRKDPLILQESPSSIIAKKIEALIN